MVSKTIIQDSPQRNTSISIVIPTYNSSKTLGMCLDSIKEQDYPGDVEINIADGCSAVNILPEKGWLIRITGLFTDTKIVGVEPPFDI